MEENKKLFGNHTKDSKAKKEKTPKPPKVKKERTPKTPKAPKPPKVKKEKVPKPPRIKKEKVPKPPRIKKEKLPKAPKDPAQKFDWKEFLQKVWTQLKRFGRFVKKWWKFFLNLFPQKSEKDAPLLDGSVKVQPVFCIQTKLIGCFIIPVAMIVLLGIISYSRASSALVSNYEGAVTQSISMTKEYFDFVFTNIESDMNVDMSGQDLNDYYSGIYDVSEAQTKATEEAKKKMDETQAALDAATEGTTEYYKAYIANTEAKEDYDDKNDRSNTNSEKAGEIYKNLNASLANKVASNNFISNIFIFKDGRYNISTNMKLRHADSSESEQNSDAVAALDAQNFYQTFTKTAFGKAVVDDMMSYHWNGPQPELDKDFQIKSDDYILRVAHSLTDTSDGVIIVDLKKSTINEILTNLNLGEGSYIGIISPDGQELVTEGKAITTTDDADAKATPAPTTAPAEEEAKATIYSDKDFYKEAVASEDETGTSYVSYDGSKYLFVYAKLGSSNMMLCALIPNAVIIKDANTIKWMTILLVIIAALIAMLVGTLISRGFSKSINKTIKQLEKVSKGDLTVEFRTNRRDEFALLYGSSNDMIKNIRGLIQEVESVYDALSVSLDKVDSSSTTFSQTTKDIQTSIHEIETGITQQSDDAADCLTQMDSLFGKINVVNENTDEIGTIARSTKDAIDLGLQSMDTLNDRTTSTSDVTNSILNTIEELSIRSKNIGQIVNTINDIAEETNLLSLNASIEAARAGAAGRGFAVVAGEIRKLADQCLASANKISGIVGEITTKTKDAVETAHTAEEIVQAQVLAVQSTSESFNEMNTQVEKLNNYLEVIHTSSKDMEQSGSNTLNSMESISSILEETSASISSVTSIVDMQTNALGDLDDASTQLVDRANNLGEAISKFNTNK